MNDALTERDKQIIGECLSALAHGPFIPDWEFSIICNCERDEMAQLAANWPQDEDSEGMRWAINDAMNNLIGYPHHEEEELSKRVSAPREEITDVYRKWRRLKWERGEAVPSA